MFSLKMYFLQEVSVKVTCPGYTQSKTLTCPGYTESNTLTSTHKVRSQRGNMLTQGTHSIVTLSQRQAQGVPMPSTHEGSRCFVTMLDNHQAGHRHV